MFHIFLLTFHFSLFSPDRSMVDDTSTIADIQHDLSFTLQNYMLSDNFPAHRPRVTFHVSHISGNFPQFHSEIIRTGNNRIFSK